MRGYFGIGVEGVSKPMNAGNLFRTAHGFGAGFVFTIDSKIDPHLIKSDTSNMAAQIPFYGFDDVDSIQLPERCSLIGIELTEDAVELPSFRHPRNAAYVLGMERGSLSPSLQECCDYIVKIDNTPFIFYTTEDSSETAWTNDDEKVIYAMKKGLKLMLSGESSRGTITNDTYTLKGFTSAINKLNQDC